MFKRWIAVGGVLGMLGTLGVLTMLPSDVRYEEVVKLSQERLADTMRRIEYRKAESGNYPASLEEFAVDRHARLVGGERPIVRWMPEYPASMLDPTREGRNVLFYELTSDGRYHLRETGPDGRSFTGDDIVPDVMRQPEGSLGLVEARVASSGVIQALPQ